MNIKKIGIIGVGGIACGRHIPELKSVRNCKITAICDIDENKLKRMCFDMNNANILGVCSGAVDVEIQNIHNVKVPLKFHTTQEAEFVKMLYGEKDEILPTVVDGLRSQKILDAILESSKKTLLD